jgi:hypothetical protein
MGRGIDYSGPGGTCNRDATTGIGYGIIPLSALSEFAHESFEAEYDDLCPHCGEDWPADLETGRLHDRGSHKERGADCPACGKFVRDGDTTGDEPSREVLDDGSYQGFLDSSGDAWFTLSPYFTRAQFCSPCAPGACYLTNPTEDGERAYCPGPDWFDDEAPYPIYSVATGRRVPTVGAELIATGPGESFETGAVYTVVAVHDGKMDLECAALDTTVAGVQIDDPNLQPQEAR